MDFKDFQKDRKITKDMTVTEVLEYHPLAAEVFKRQGMPEAGCASSLDNETIEEMAKLHGRDPEQLVKALNVTRYASERRVSGAL